MSDDLLAWPAFGQQNLVLPGEIRYELGIWGKVLGARSDFRWIARTSHFEPGEQDLARQLSLGTEDQPGKAHLWRNRGARCYAVSLYPSRARDASGRTDFIEKQVLAWDRPPGVPAALGALLLLPHAASLTDQTWWDRYDEGRWADPAFSLPIPATEHAPCPVRRDELAAALREGVRELNDDLRPEELKNLYAQLQAGRRPAWLTGVKHPLSPRALAALLMPLPPDLADSLSLAGWIPSSRFSLEDLADRWDVLVLTPDLESRVELQSVDQEAESQGSALAKALLELGPELAWPVAFPAMAASTPEPAAEALAAPARPVETARLSPPAAQRPRAEIALPPPPSGASDLLRELHAFACTIERRWLDPEPLKSRFHPFTGPELIPERLFPSWIEELREGRPEHANEEQWMVKLDLLRSAALLFRPTADTLQAVGRFESNRIPALSFAVFLGKPELVREMDKDLLEQALQQSRDCIASPWTRRFQAAVARWQSGGKRPTGRSR